MKSKIRNMEPVYSGRCHKCMTEVEDVRQSEMQRLSILKNWFLPRFFCSFGCYGTIKCPNPNCNSKIELLLERWKEKTQLIEETILDEGEEQ